MPRRLPRIVCFLLFSAIVATTRLHTYDEPLERDITTYAVIGHELLSGRSLYSDLWDHKPPAIHTTFALAEIIAGYGPGAIYLLGLAAALLTLFGVMSASAVMGTWAALWGGGFWVVVSGDMMLQANQPNAEVFINASLVLGFALLVREPGHHRLRGRAWWIGGLFALATLYKPVASATALLLLAAHVAFSSGDGADRGSRLRDALVAVSAIATAWIVVVAYFAFSARLQPFWDAVILYNRAYQARGWEIGGIGRGLFPSSMWFLFPLFALTAFGSTEGIRRGDSRHWLLLAAYLVGTLVSIALPGRLYPHYLQLWLPPLCVGAGWGLEALMRLQPRFGWLFGFGALAATLAHEIPNFALTADQWSESKYGAVSRYGKVFVSARDLALKIDAILLPTETFFEFGDETGLYFLTQRRPPSGVLYAYPLVDGPLVTTLSARLVEDLKRERPELFVVNASYVHRDEDGRILIANQPALVELLAEYKLAWVMRGSPDFFLFTLDGGALEGRATQSPQSQPFEVFEQ